MQAQCYDSLGQLDHHVSNFSKSLSIIKSITQKRYPVLCYILNRVAEYSIASSPERANALMDRSRIITLRFEKEDQDLTNCDLFQLQGNLSLRQHKLDESEKSFKDAIALREIGFGYESPELIESVTKLAAVYAEKKEDAAAQQTFERGLATMEKAWQSGSIRDTKGVVDANAACSQLIDAYATWLKKQDKSDQALELSEKWKPLLLKAKAKHH